jgi:type III secretion system low calcium response chaperone LcrH/SycD
MEASAEISGFEDVLRHLLSGHTLKSKAGIGEEEMEAIYAVAFNHFNGGKMDKAQELFKLLCLYDHTQPRWFYGLGTVRQSLKDWKGAVDAYGLATVLDVDDPRPQAQAAYCLMALEKWPEAQSALEGALMTCAQDAPRHAEVQKQAEELLAVVKARNPAKTEGQA